MSMPMSNAVLRSAITEPFTWGPTLDGPALRGDGTASSLRITARRLLPVRPDDLFALWTRRTAWDAWLRLRARSRAMMEPSRGGRFRLELAEGPTIHVITGVFEELRRAHHLVLTWVREGACTTPSRVDVQLEARQQLTALTLCHSQIASRREAAWLMRVWTSALGRLEIHARTNDVEGHRRQLLRQRRSARGRVTRGSDTHRLADTAPFGHVASLP